jgi:hypothetical protein
MACFLGYSFVRRAVAGELAKRPRSKGFQCPAALKSFLPKLFSWWKSRTFGNRLWTWICVGPAREDASSGCVQHLDHDGIRHHDRRDAGMNFCSSDDTSRRRDAPGKRPIVILASSEWGMTSHSTPLISKRVIQARFISAHVNTRHRQVET